MQFEHGNTEAPAAGLLMHEHAAQMVASALFNDERGELTLEPAVFEATFHGDRSLGAPRRAIRHDLCRGPNDPLYIGADQDCAGSDQAETMAVDRAVVGAGKATGAIEAQQMSVEILDRRRRK